MVKAAAYFMTLFEALYAGLESRDTTWYRWADSDAWTRSRTPLDWTRHLEFWIDFGSEVKPTRPSYIHAARLIFAARYTADDDCVAQARLHAAIRDAIEYLLTADLPEAARVMEVTSAFLEGGAAQGLVTATLGFSLYLPR